MKKSVSIILLILFLFNVGGYHIVYWGLRYQTDLELTNRLDANLYNPDETILLKIPVPVSLPYPFESDGFKRVNGRFEHNGEYFKLIKNKLQPDTLFVVCIRDQETRQLAHTMKDYVLLTQGLADSSPSQQALNFLSKLVKDYCSQEDVTLIHQKGFAILITYKDMAENLLQPLLPVHAPPPRISS